MTSENKLPQGIKIVKDENGLPIIKVTGLPYLVKDEQELDWNTDWDYNI
jgi:hypothetical protein